LELLTPLEEIVVRLSFGLGEKPREISIIAGALELRPAAVRRLRRNAIAKLRRS